jgi:hypothetical protein
MSRESVESPISPGLTGQMSPVVQGFVEGLLARVHRLTDEGHGSHGGEE